MNLQKLNPHQSISNLEIKDFDAVQAVFEKNGFTEEKGIQFSCFEDMSGYKSKWGEYENGQQGFGVCFRNEDDGDKVQVFADTLPFLDYITEMGASDDEGKYYDTVYYVDNVAFDAYQRKQKIQEVLED